MNLRNKFFILLTIGVFLTGQWGCATGPYGYPKPEALLEEYRAQLGTIGVTTGKEVPVIELNTPPPVMTSTTPGVFTRMGQGASDGAAKTGGWMWEGCKEGGEGAGRSGGGVFLYLAVWVTWCVLSVPVGILGGIGGFFYGAFPSAESSAYPAADEVTLRYTVANYPIRMVFQNSFLKEARARTSHTFVVVPKEGSQTSEGMAEPRVDTVLELSVKSIWLKRVDDREENLNPPMVWEIVVEARLMRSTEKTVWYDQTFVHETKKRPYKEWPYHYNFQTAIEQAYQNLAEQMVNKLFSLTQTSQQ